METLSKYMRDNNLSEEDVLNRLQVVELDPAKDLYVTMIDASKDLTRAVKLKTLDLTDDIYQKSLFQLLQAGDKVSKSLRLAKLEAFPEEEDDSAEISFLDRTARKK
jgi:hypothetical protein